MDQLPDRMAWVVLGTVMDQLPDRMAWVDLGTVMDQLPDRMAWVVLGIANNFVCVLLTQLTLLSK
jgi:hypothetical protein